jgi:hypothetical protein
VYSGNFRYGAYLRIMKQALAAERVREEVINTRPYL